MVEEKVEVYNMTKKEIVKDLLSAENYGKVASSLVRSTGFFVKDIFIFIVLSFLQAIKLIVLFANLSVKGYKEKVKKNKLEEKNGKTKW